MDGVHPLLSPHGCHWNKLEALAIDSTIEQKCLFALAKPCGSKSKDQCRLLQPSLSHEGAQQHADMYQPKYG